MLCVRVMDKEGRRVVSIVLSPWLQVPEDREAGGRGHSQGHIPVGA